MVHRRKPGLGVFRVRPNEVLLFTWGRARTLTPAPLAPIPVFALLPKMVCSPGKRKPARRIVGWPGTTGRNQIGKTLEDGEREEKGQRRVLGWYFKIK